MIQKQPVFKDTKKIVKKFQEICDKNKDKPAVMFLDEYRIENGKEWHNGK